ncbi:twin-arginine translocase subunit TatC [Gammaproteobacteria bacterium]|jgi:sec-independent protein translocase protein TatC|nr:twin-arginine translocase subunit TatC [Gammaproteobacteria bacterium]MDA9343228.1 twin-arginine translocase subunit TatC [Gammaproteobacteria bacterium]MDB2582783.1 twin-arginine translocase subunit TatC [Gammaproteobacteria bacterium]MDB4120213.1 twin-arginine translocase subunit TatC [Gammaproteobacteria bacterium]MDB4135527.1 twin-arginine translocase subunit TatC [Gammaproteobacteria bacterium]|tara:strand:+ start:548 stop:1249 length:702 start_codon:yes stop_codon:yes gene_type:complete
MNKESISSHLLELRTRLIRVLICLGILSVAGIPFASQIYAFVASPLLDILPAGSSMIATQVTSPFMAPLKLVLFSALLITMPYLFYEIWMFMSPGLYKNEKSFVAPLMVSTILLFSAGVVFAYLVVLPIIFKFFIGVAPESIQVMTDINQYLSFVIKLIFAFGIAFEIPIATFLLIRTGIAKKESLIKARPYLIILFFVIGMLLTPPDIFSQLFLAIPMWILFELGLLFSKNK